ncbi:MAG TPA: FtsQ-type POTRA domain-containing protein [Candidatus Sulfotelmatobacter sp.]|nr:FtsQ-type POTRA domain-containing protein [Candidatus Sulfotelmatobacter sp.]
MKLRRRRSLVSRLSPRRTLEPSEPLKGQLWTRSEKALREPDVHWAWRSLAAAAAVLETVLLGWLWFGPALAIHTVDVTGSQHLTAAQVTRAAGLMGTASVISIDGESARQGLLNQTWIRTASVEPQLPGSVVIQVSEWEPVAAFHAGSSKKLFYLSDQSVVLGPTPSDAGLLDVQGPAGADPHTGDRPLDPQLLVALVNIQRDFPALLGQQVAGFVFDSCGDLTLVAKKGWKVYFGRVLTPEQFVTLRDKLSALKAIAGGGNVNYNSTDLEYVNVMNPAEPAVGYRSLEPPIPSPQPGATPAPSPSSNPATTCR